MVLVDGWGENGVLWTASRYRFLLLDHSLCSFLDRFAFRLLLVEFLLFISFITSRLASNKRKGKVKFQQSGLKAERRSKSKQSERS